MLGHHAVFLVSVGSLNREVLGEITEMQNKKELQHDICTAPNFHLCGGSYFDSVSPVH